jgi:S-adenosylmethionine:tRNA-ribosyltransferase-isomerase (queuine synthetase)
MKSSSACFEHISYSVLEPTLSHSDLKIASEDSLSEFIISRILQNANSLNLLESVKFEYLSTDNITMFHDAAVTNGDVDSDNHHDGLADDNQNKQSDLEAQEHHGKHAAVVGTDCVKVLDASMLAMIRRVNKRSTVDCVTVTFVIQIWMFSLTANLLGPSTTTLMIVAVVF